MSGMNSKPVSSLLPDDVEELLANAKKKIFSLGEQIKITEANLEAKKVELALADTKLVEVTGKINEITSLIDTRNAEFLEKEKKLNQRESALDVYANALEEKEKKIKKYLVIFENMKDVIS